MIRMRADIGLSQNGIACWIQPHLSSRPLTRPSLANILPTYSRDTNCGTAMVMTRIVRQSFFSLMPFLLIMMATAMPRK